MLVTGDTVRHGRFGGIRALNAIRYGAGRNIIVVQGG